jgi:hypothetical protein
MQPGLKTLPELKLLFAALSAFAFMVGALAPDGSVGYYVYRWLKTRLAGLVQALRITLLHKAFAIAPTLPAYTPRLHEFNDAADDLATSENETEIADTTPVYPALATEDVQTSNARDPQSGRLVLWIVGRGGSDTRASRRPYYWIPDSVPTRRLALSFQAMARVLADPERHARRLALILTRPPLWARRNPAWIDPPAPLQPEPDSPPATEASTEIKAETCAPIGPCARAPPA